MRKKIKTFYLFGIAALGAVFIFSCSGNSSNADMGYTTGIFEYPNQLTDKGIGPITNLTLEPLDASLAGKGKSIYEQKCVACHAFDKKLIGPPLDGVTKRRTPEWIMNMIINPVEMTKNDTLAKDILSKVVVQMVFQDISKDDARAILEYLRQKEELPKIK